MDKLLDRRNFVRRTCSLMSLGAAAEFLKACSKNKMIVNPTGNFTVDLSAPANAALQTVGGAIVQNGIVIIRKSTNIYIALSSICTHAGCTVVYNNSTTQLDCPCHGSIFNNSGQVLQGPAKSPLQIYSVSVSGNTLMVL